MIAVIPFLLGIMPNQTVSDEVRYEFTFQVDVQVTYNIHPNTKLHPFPYLSVNLKCHNIPNASSLMCRVGKYNALRPMPDGLMESRFDKDVYKTEIIDYRVFQSDSEPFQINFSPKGIDGYVVERNAIPTRMMNVYRMIANELSVGVNLKQEERKFKQMERSNIGLCPTSYKIQELPLFLSHNLNLTSLVGLPIDSHTILVLKHRFVLECRPLSEFLFSERFWPEIIPTTSDSYSLVRATNVLTMTSRGMESLTENVFELYDLNNQVDDIFSETIALKLTSYRALPLNDGFTFDGKETVLLNVTYDDN